MKKPDKDREFRKSVGKNKKVIGLSIFFLLIALIISGDYFGVIPSNMTGTITSSLLVIVTAVYVVMTWELVKETRDAREQEVLPFFKIKLQPVALSNYGVKIINYGNGPAHNVSVTLTLVPTNGSSEKSASKEVNGVSPGNFIGFFQPFEDINLSKEITNNYEKILLEGQCKDVFGKTHPIEDEYDLELLEHPDESSAFRTREEKYLKDIAKNLKKIRKNLR